MFLANFALYALLLALVQQHGFSIHLLQLHLIASRSVISFMLPQHHRVAFYKTPFEFPRAMPVNVSRQPGQYSSCTCIQTLAGLRRLMPSAA